MDSPLHVRAENGIVHIDGDLTFHTVSRVLERIRGLLGADTGATLTLDFGAARRTDSAALALLLECIREAGRRNRGIVYRNLPQRLLQLARISDIDTLIGAHSGESVGSNA